MAKTLLIFGGSGFIGSYIVRRLSKLGFKIIIPTSKPNKSKHLKLSGSVGQVLPIKLNFKNFNEIKKIMNKSDIIINLKTVWSESKNNSYKKNIFDFNKLIIDNIKDSKIDKYIYFSGIGTSINSSSKRTIEIARVENYIISNLKNYSIIRPSIVIGSSDKFISKLSKIIKLSLLIPIFGSGKNKIQPTFVDDVALAVEKLILKKINDNKIYELGGNLILSYKEVYKLIAKEMNLKRFFFHINFFFAKIGVYFIEKLPIDLLTTEQLELFKEDNLVSGNYLTYKNLEIQPKDTKQLIKKIIKNLE